MPPLRHNNRSAAWNGRSTVGDMGSTGREWGPKAESDCGREERKTGRKRETQYQPAERDWSRTLKDNCNR
jgi:hypothetical protein